MNYRRETSCSDCKYYFLSMNPRTHRCDTCKAERKSRKSFTRKCCICSEVFTSQAIYTVCCSIACGRIAANNGKAKIAKAGIREANKSKREYASAKKADRSAARLASLWTKQKIEASCREIWGGRWGVVAPASGGSSCELEIICAEHGCSTVPFRNKPIQDVPCRECRAHHSKLSRDEFAARSKAKFGDKYEITEYECTEKDMAFICPLHGNQTMLARVHLKSPTGCAECTKAAMDYARNPYGVISPTTAGRAPDEVIGLYVVRYDGGFKVGLSRDAKKRLTTLKKHLVDAELLHYETGRLADMFMLEQLLLAACKKKKAPVEFGGHTECVEINPMLYIEDIRREVLSNGMAESA